MKVRKAVIPVAGFGTRFLPFTKAVPKEMLPIIDTPTLQHIVKEAVDSGIKEILFITNRGKSSIENHFDRAIELEALLEKSGKTEELESLQAINNMAKIFYIRQKDMLGLGHAILQAKEFVGDEPFAVLLGDDVVYNPQTPAIGQLIEKFEETGATIVGCQKVPMTEISKYGSIEGDKLDDRTYRVKRSVEKPKMEEAPSDIAILGRYVFTAKIFDYIEETKAGVGGEIQITDAIDKTAKHDELLAYIFQGRRYDMGNKQGFLEATVEYALRDESLSGPFKAYLKGLDF